MARKRKKSLFRKLWSLPTRLFSTRLRLSVALVCGVTFLLLVAQIIEILPDPNQPVMDARKLQCETLAITGSAIAQSRRDLKVFKSTLENSAERAEGLLSIGLRNKNGNLDIEVGDHANNWVMPSDGRSTDQFMFVPIFRGSQQVGQLELRYKPLVNLKNWFHSDAAKLVSFIFFTSFLTFNLILYRTLNQLDPRGAVPQRVREAFDNMAEGLLILDKRGHVMLANSKFGSLVGVEAERLTGRNVSEFDWDLTAEENRLPWEIAIETNAPVTDALIQTTDAENHQRTFIVSAAPVMGQNNQSRGSIVTFDDITALEENKRELIAARKAADDANEAKSNFLSRMSHEIRTPMNAIIGYTDILRQGVQSQDDQVRYLSTIQTSGEHLLALINDILDLSKVEAGQMSIERRQFHLVPLVTQVIDTLIVKSAEKDLFLAFEVYGKIPHVIETDETRLRQVLINIIGNAIKFTETGGVRLLGRTVEANNKTMLQFDVIDTGIGIPEKALKTIFDPFSQADSSVTRRFGGTGLGLAISKQLSEAMGGRITATSEQGVGTTFSITIDPGKIVDDVRWITNETLHEEKKILPTENKVELRFDGSHVLIVDDAKANRDLAAIMVKRLGLTCDMANNGFEALERIAENQYDIVLMDMNMPVMDGLTATKHIRETGLEIPVVALTAMVIPEEKKKCLDGGCDSFLAKPIRHEALVNVLSEFLESTVVETEVPINQQKVKSNPQPANPQATKAPYPPAPTVSMDTRESLPTVVMPDFENSDIESGLMETLASLGIEDDDLEVSGATTEGGLALPDAVVSSLPPEPEFMAIVMDFVGRLPDKLKEFDVALAAGSQSQLSDLGHWLAGATSTVGLDAFVAPARELEHSDGSDPARTAALVQHFHDLAARIQCDASV